MDWNDALQLRRQQMPRVLLGETYTAYGEKHTVYWSYIQAIMLLGYWRHGEQTGDPEELLLVRQYMDRMLDEGLEKHVNISYYSTDQFCMAYLLLLLHDRWPSPRYRQAADQFYAQFADFPRTPQGNFWHKENYPQQVWLDGLYMANPFRVGYRQRFAPAEGQADVLQQLASARELLYDPRRRLYLHACDTSRQMFWCDPDTGRSPNCWLRAVGWLSMALVDLYALPGLRAEALRAQLIELIDGMLPHRRESMWYQVVDHEGERGNHLETSGSLMLAYSLMAGARTGMLPAAHARIGQETFESVLDHSLLRQDGALVLDGICESAGLGVHPETGAVRDGSYAYYTTGERITPNNGHGVGAFLLAFNEYAALRGEGTPCA